jgi:hypothetical protein
MTLPNLPIELINKILILRPTHPIAQIMNHIIFNYYKNNYEYENLEKDFIFSEWYFYCQFELSDYGYDDDDVDDEQYEEYNKENKLADMNDDNFLEFVYRLRDLYFKSDEVEEN